jgi:hypothetical protein
MFQISSGPLSSCLTKAFSCVSSPVAEPESEPLPPPDPLPTENGGDGGSERGLEGEGGEGRGPEFEPPYASRRRSALGEYFFVAVLHRTLERMPVYFLNPFE